MRYGCFFNRTDISVVHREQLDTKLSPVIKMGNTIQTISMWRSRAISNWHLVNCSSTLLWRKRDGFCASIQYSIQFNIEHRNNALPTKHIPWSIQTISFLFYHLSIKDSCHMSTCVPEAGISIAGTSSDIPQILWDVITWPCPWYKSSYVHQSSGGLFCGFGTTEGMSKIGWLQTTVMCKQCTYNNFLNVPCEPFNCNDGSIFLTITGESYPTTVLPILDNLIQLRCSTLEKIHRNRFCNCV